MIPSILMPLANHLWQSTLFAVAIWLITLALRKNRAAVRHRLWLVASVKFLVPFSLLAGLGSYIQWPVETVPTPPPAVAAVVNSISQPFAMPETSFVPPANAIAPAPTPGRLPTVLLLVWLCGFAASIIWWSVRWSQLRRMSRRATRLNVDAPLPVMRCPERIEPGVFGIFRPLLLLPEDIADQLSPEELQAVLAHEFCHVRRRDNLTAAIHMVVEAVFWFHPLVWWIKARLIEEQERACDEAVLGLGGNPQVYAESILKICEFYVTAPLICVSGIAGSDLEKRIEEIMRNRVTAKLSPTRVLLLSAAAIMVLGGPIAIGVLSATPGQAPSQRTILPETPPQTVVGPSAIGRTTTEAASTPGRGLAPAAIQPQQEELKFEVATIRPNTAGISPDPRTTPTGCRGVDTRPDRRADRPRVPLGRCIFRHVLLDSLIRQAYAASLEFSGPDILTGGPDWLRSERYDIEAKAADPSTATGRDMYRMLRALLADRFMLTLRRESKGISGYALVVAKNGPKLVAAKNTDVNPNVSGRETPGRMTLIGLNASMVHLAGSLSRFGIGSVANRTDLQGPYDFELTFAPDADMSAPKGPGPLSILPGAGPSLFTAVEEQLGLRLTPQKLNMEYLVIESIERPSAN